MLAARKVRALLFCSLLGLFLCGTIEWMLVSEDRILKIRCQQLLMKCFSMIIGEINTLG